MVKSEALRVEPTDLIVSFMLAAPQPMNEHVCGYCCFYNGEFHEIFELPNVPCFNDLIISLQSQLLNETFSGVSRIFTRPRHLPWSILNPPRWGFKKCANKHFRKRYYALAALKEVLYGELIRRHIKLQPALMGTDHYLIFLIGCNIVKMKLGKLIGVPIDKMKLHQENLRYTEKLINRGVKINYGQSVVEDQFNIKLD